jgi:micrococcal nuclease
MEVHVRVRGRLLFVLLVAVLPLTAHWGWTASGGAPLGEEVMVTGVVDGDTIYVGRGWRRTLVRLKGIDTPETVHPRKPVEFYGPEATRFTRRRVDGQWVRLQVEEADRIDVYGRLLAYVFLNDGSFVNEELVRKGYARALTRFPTRYADLFESAEAEARTAGRGLWSAGARTEERGRAWIIGNRRSKIYHVPGQEHYDDVAARNRELFRTEAEARAAGYRRARR